MQKNNSTSTVKVYPVNGYEDDEKFVEIDGQKFVADDADPSKAKLDDKGEKIPVKAKADDKGDGGSGSGQSLEELAKSNPEVAKLLDEKKQRDEDEKKRQQDEEKRKEKEAQEKGEWQKLAEERGKKVDELQSELGKKDEILGKYVGSTKQILAEVMATIPKENQGLIPDNFSPREKLEYITKNAKLLGAKIVGAGKGSSVDKNDSEPPSSELEKLNNEFLELQKKKDKTPTELNQMSELAKKIKEARAAKGNK